MIPSSGVVFMCERTIRGESANRLLIDGELVGSRRRILYRLEKRAELIRAELIRPIWPANTRRKKGRLVDRRSRRTLASARRARRPHERGSAGLLAGIRRPRGETI